MTLNFDAVNTAITCHYSILTSKPHLSLPSYPQSIYRPVASTKSRCLVTETRMCEQLAQSHYMKVEESEVNWDRKEIDDIWASDVCVYDDGT